MRVPSTAGGIGPSRSSGGPGRLRGSGSRTRAGIVRRARLAGAPRPRTPPREGPERCTSSDSRGQRRMARPDRVHEHGRALASGIEHALQLFVNNALVFSLTLEFQVWRPIPSARRA